MAEYIKRETLLAAYDREHEGEPGRARELIANAPAEDVQPVRHGRWTRIDYEPIGHDYICSVCEWRNDMASHYCPNCGAKMERWMVKHEKYSLLHPGNL